MKKKTNKGFTLTEMIVVIAIIGILAGVLIPAITGYIKKSQQNAAYQEATGVLDIYETYLTEQDAGLTSFNYFADYYLDIVGEELSENYYIQYNMANITNPDCKAVNLVYVASEKIVVLINFETKKVSYLDENPVPTDAAELYESVYTALADVQ